MNIRIIILIIIVLLIIIGFIKVFFTVIRTKSNIDFLIEYRNNLVKLINGEITNEEYNYVYSNATKMQETLGTFGVMDYRPAFSNTYIRNYSIINSVLNYNGSYCNDEINLLIKTVDIYIGKCINYIDKLKKQAKNPFGLFANGFQLILNTPFYILNCLGIISTKTYYSIIGSMVYRLLNKIILLIGLVSSIIGIIQGKEVLKDIYEGISNFVASIFNSL